MDQYAALICDRLAPDLSGVHFGVQRRRAIQPGEMRISVRAAALNFPDLLMTEGGYQHKPELPFVPGMEGAGVVTEIAGSGATFRIGDRVCFSGKSGACAEEVVVPVTAVWPLPDGFSFAQGAAFKVGALTAWVSLVARGQLQSGETLLVHGGSGGMGLAAVQLGVHLGARVIATGTSLERLEPARLAGADEVLLIDEHFRERLKKIVPGGVDVIFDPVGGDAFDQSLRVIGWGGRLLVVGFASGQIPRLPVNIALIKGFSVIGVRAGEYGRRDPIRGAECLRAIRELAARGVMTPVIGARFSLADSKQALVALRERAAPGKIVVDVSAQPVQ
ncbi:MAG: NADPH:quinone oxidoreductase family protein [Burkholderiaceae bacterium]